MSDSDLGGLFHQLNNQLGVILANAELLEQRLVDEGHKSRAGQIVSGALEAISTAKHIKQLTYASADAK
jgi:hypothetical protein